MIRAKNGVDKSNGCGTTGNKKGFWNHNKKCII
jgi:hypothetical protein